MDRSWVRMILAIALLFAMSGGNVQRKALAAPDDIGAVIHFGCDVSGCLYHPSEVVIQPGETVEWDGDFSMHPLVSDDGLWPTHMGDTPFTWTFPMTGTFLFHCAIHGGFGGVGMSGRVVVKEFPNKIYLPLVLSV